MERKEYAYLFKFRSATISRDTMSTYVYADNDDEARVRFQNQIMGALIINVTKSKLNWDIPFQHRPWDAILGFVSFAT